MTKEFLVYDNWNGMDGRYDTYEEAIKEAKRLSALRDRPMFIYRSYKAIKAQMPETDKLVSMELSI